MSPAASLRNKDSSPLMKMMGSGGIIPNETPFAAAAHSLFDDLPAEDLFDDEIARVNRWRTKLSGAGSQRRWRWSHSQELGVEALPSVDESTAPVADEPRPTKLRVRWAKLPPPLFPKSKGDDRHRSLADGENPQLNQKALSANQVAPLQKNGDEKSPGESMLARFGCVIS